MPPKPNVPSQFLTMDEVCRLVRLHRETVRRMIKAGKFPKPIHVSSRRLIFRRTEIEAWLKRREEEGA